MTQSTASAQPNTVSRRQALGMAAAATLALQTSTRASLAETSPEKGEELKGNIRHSAVEWCFKSHFDSFDALCAQAKSLGCQSVELAGPEHWPTLKQHGLTCAIAGSHGFVRGMNDPNHWDECHQKIRDSVDAAAAAGFPSVITFTGMRESIPDDVGLKNCVEGFKQIVGYAEAKGITLCLEMLNSRVSDHPMKGHPGYQGDHTDYCIEILKQVGSPRLKLLFDIYHVQIMDGDVISRIRQHKDYIGHVHTAGNPGRGELDHTQEINYAPIMQALVDVGYQGYVGHEFIPTRDASTGLAEAIAWCDV